MATVNNPSLQGASGKIDGHVAYTVGKKTYLRKLAVSISTGPSGEASSKKSMPSRRKRKNEGPAITGFYTPT